jgi:lipopolysaccharide/colanic/teichoic acid biosynthesis glycosyltransferase
VALDWVGSLPVLGIRPLDPKGWQFRVKYALDKPAALFALTLLAPIMAVVAVAVKLTSPGPVLFRQRRIGQDGQVFEMLKFRSMYLPTEVYDFQLTPGLAPGGIEGLDRRTPLGRFLRRSGLDELPQLINVVRGEMSVVGPRPERPEFVNAFGAQLDRYTDRHRVKSGITGWAQVSGLRGQTSLVDRVEMDNYYIRNWSLSLDLKIALLTVPAVLRTGHDA